MGDWREKKTVESSGKWGSVIVVAVQDCFGGTLDACLDVYPGSGLR
jgi:hypothetical protein